MFQETTAVKKIVAMKKRLRILQGGSSAGKTIGILACLIDYGQSRDTILISVVSETLPHLKKGAIRDFLNIMQEHGYYKDEMWNRTDYIYTFHNGSKIEFFSADSADKVRGPRRDVLFMNEANNMSYETYTQLSIRTNKIIYIDFNPVSEFWVHSEIIPKLPHDFEILTYLDNEALPPAIVQEIESRKDNKYFWQVYGLGEIGEALGKVYTGWRIIDELPFEARLVRRFLDFGYSNDPTVIGSIYYYNGGYILHEECYQKGLLNKQIADLILNLEEPNMLVKADSAEPKSIEELRQYGVNILPATKGKDSISYGINKVQSEKISITSSSINGIKEYRNYLWATDRDGNVIPNTPIGIWNHFLDGVRYGFDGLDDREPQLAVFTRGDSITQYGAHAEIMPAVHKGYQPKKATFRTFR